MTNFEYLKTLSLEDFVELVIASAPCDMCVHGFCDCYMETPTCLKGRKEWLAQEHKEEDRRSSLTADFCPFCGEKIEYKKSLKEENHNG